MRWTRRGLIRWALLTGGTVQVFPGLSLARSGEAAAGGADVIRSHGDSLIGALKYPAGFKYLDYVNPDAPKGGKVRIYGQRTFDSFNGYIAKGTPVSYLGLLSDTLMAPVMDRDSEHYGLLAEWAEHPKDYSYVIYKLREDARWHDGRPITAEDLIFGFEMLTTKGHPLYKHYYRNISETKDLGGGLVRFDFDQTGNRELPHITGQLEPLPKHWWADRDFTQSSLEPPLGSGPYKIGDFEAGRHVEFIRVEDYWAMDLPINVGTHNFDVIRLEAFQDDSAAFEAFKTGDLHFRAENSAKNWAKEYEFDAVDRGDVLKEKIVLEASQRVQTFTFNLRRAKFQDVRVRKALSLLFDFEWTNETIYYGQYARPVSYFQGTKELMATGLPDEKELEHLEPFRDQLPPELFTKEFANHTTDGSGRDRKGLRAAKALLGEAGYRVEEGKMYGSDGERFEIEFLLASQTQEKVIGPMLKNFQRLGIDATARTIDAAQYTRRYRARDFDMLIGSTRNSVSPGNEQREFWGSKAADDPGSRNVAGVQDPVVDALIEKIIYAENREALTAASRALDRVLLWNHYEIMQLYTPFERIAYWKHLKRPDPLPRLSYGFPTIWWAEGDAP